MNPIKLNHILKKIVEKNDEKAFSVFFDHYHTRLLNLALLFLPNYQQAEELVSEVILKLLQKREGLLQIQNFEGYLFKMVKNRALNSIKASSREKGKISIDDIQDYLIPDVSDPEKKMINGDLKRELNRVIANLPPKRRLVFKMVKDENLSYKEVAEILEISERTVEVHLKLAITDLRGTLQQFYDEYQGRILVSNQRFLSLFL
ncbi:RNA polymerase sigma-70 factor [Echinicola sp. CAU 1574]|uniref:RNA polymerase sigma-70 factor n=1 Tax=Echinicola arenosa TaxID=2774144 RepID=A0ABR9ALJ7_9BACT|nr:RNA polymerase sigma-70 factor [Echinicola arenosa]MBD8488494.1 RNA polymerase sigma-70 factor [Echinicola arenosa]